MSKYNMTIEEALAELDSQLAKMQAETNREQLKGIDPDTAFEKGYKAAIFDFRHYTGPSPSEEYGDAVRLFTEMESQDH